MSRVEEALRRALSGSLDGVSRPKARDPEADRLTLKQFSPEPKLSESSPPVVAASPRASAKVASYASQLTSRLLEPIEIPEGKLEAEPESERDGSVDPRPEAVSAGTSADHPSEGVSDDESEKLVDLRQIADYLRFVAGSLRRHVILGTATFLLSLAMTVAAVMFLPKTYHAQAKLLAQRNAVMAALSNPGRAVPWDADAPTRSASETVLRRENLLSLMKQTDLMNEWERTRIPLLRLKDWFVGVILGRPTPDEKRDQLLGMLETRLLVTGGPVGDGTITIDLEWPDADMAFRLVQAAQQEFVKARQTAEVATIGDSIGILERYAATLHSDIDRTLGQLKSAKSQRRSTAETPRTSVSSPTAVMPSLAATLPPLPDAALGSTALTANLDDPRIPRLKVSLDAKRREIAGIEGTRQRELSELQSRFSQLSSVYTAQHPTLVGLKKNIEALSRETPQLTALKEEARALETEYQERLAAAEELFQLEHLKDEGTKSAPVVSAPPVAAAPPARQPTASPDPSGEADFASVRFRLELNQLESVLERIDGARIELAVSQAASKYRYTVIRPAEVPRKPVRPNPLTVFGAGLFGSIVLALAAVVGRDVLSNRVLEPWQVERQLGLPILGISKNL
jgi:uncharacterized protein involved in exopolysaccharide biosynthesis